MLDDKSDFIYGEKSGFLYGESGLEFFGPPVEHSRNIIDEPEGIDKPGTATGQSGDRPEDPALQGKPPGVVSLTTIEVQDAICEGPIEGLASGKYEYVGTKGDVGYTSAKFAPYFPITTVSGGYGVDNAHQSGYLRSIFYNSVEILDKNGRKNFQNVNVSWTDGTPGGVPLILDEGSNQSLEVLRNVGERLRGPEMRYKASGDANGVVTFPTNPHDMELVPGQDPLGRDNAKLYKILNKNCRTFNINIKVSALGETLVDSDLPATYTEDDDGPQAVGRGDRKGITVAYKIDYRPLYNDNVTSKNIPFTKRENNVVTYLEPSSRHVSEQIYGKVSAGYIRQTKVVIDKQHFKTALDDKDFLGWEIIVYRSTPDSFTTTISSQTFVDSIVEGFDESYAYPNTAIIRSRFRADAFSQVPPRSFMVRMKKVKVPNNYNPILRTYGAARGGSSIVNGGNSDVDGTDEIWYGDWKRNADPGSASFGAIKRQWTDNPAWIFLDLLTNKRHGLGNFLSEASIDKWTLFEIAKYCDQLVPDGYGGIEPRFSANVYINTQADAHQVINDFASIFRGMALYAGGQISATSDKPQSPIYTFTNANVIGGDFSYSSSAKKARHTVCIVRYNDKNDLFKPSMVYSEDAEGIQKYGFRVRELSAFGCTSKGQALRIAKWTMVTERLETQSVAFSAGVEAAYLSPGDVFQISDVGRGNYTDLSARRRAGRTKRINISGNYTTIELDSSLSGFLDNANIAAGDKMVLNLLTPPSYADVLTANFDSSAQSIYIKKSQIQKLLFRKTDVIHSGRNDVDAGNPGHLVSIVTGLTGLNTTDFNVTGFTGLLRNVAGLVIDGTGFIENKPDDFIWAIEYTGKRLNITPDIDLYKVIGIQEREGLRFGITAIEHKPEKYNIVEEDLVFEAPAEEFFPVKPTSFLASKADIVDAHAVRVTISFSHPSIKTHLAGYKIFIKFGADFADATDYTEGPDVKFPDSVFYYTFIGSESNSFTYLPYVNGSYFIRIYPVNAGSKVDSKDQFLGGSFSVDNINLLLDLEVKSLRLQTDTSANFSADKDASESFQSPGISVRWQAGFFKDSLRQFATPGNFTYRATYRDATDSSQRHSNAPGPIILFEKTGIRPQAFFHELSMSDNLGISLPPSLSNQITPLRAFDVVVEAVDSGGFSSAGGQIVRNVSGSVTTDSTYRNAAGYDILYVNNPSLPAVHLTDRDSRENPENCDSELAAGFCTDQWVNDGGEISLSIKIDSANSILNKDARSVGFLMSKTKFTHANIEAKLQTIIDDSTLSLNGDIVFNGGVDSLVFSQNFAAAETKIQTIFKGFSEAPVLLPGESREGISEIFVSVAFLDTFIFAACRAAPAKRSLIKTLNFSNVVRIAPRGVFLRDSLLFRAWAVMHVNWESPDVLMYHTAHIDSIDLEDYVVPYIQRVAKRGRCGRTKHSLREVEVTRKARVFAFATPLPSSSYEVIILFTPDPTQYGEGIGAATLGNDRLGNRLLQVINKTINGFTVKDVSPGGYGAPALLKGTFFFGVLLGTVDHSPYLENPFGTKFNYPQADIPR